MCIVLYFIDIYLYLNLFFFAYSSLFVLSFNCGNFFVHFIDGEYNVLVFSHLIFKKKFIKGVFGKT